MDFQTDSNAAQSFGETIDPIENAINVADIVLDTNVLLLPYGAGASSLLKIVETYKTLKQAKRLFLPAQVAREFVKNRPNKVSELQQGLSDKISRYVAIDQLQFPILEGVEDYKKLNKALIKSKDLKTELNKANSALLETIRSWEWNDPVNSAYREVFSVETIIEPDIDRKKTLEELQRRKALLIPPGYKDAAKEDCGIGDFLIWKTILQLGAKSKNHIIFVSGDEKADWQHRAGGTGFLPRYELMDEFRRASGGKAFYIIQLSNLLELLNVERTSIDEIKKEEARIQEASTVVVSCPNCSDNAQFFLAANVGASGFPTCPACENKFHIHRTEDGVTVHRANVPTRAEVALSRKKSEVFVCPACECICETELGTYSNATRWCRCVGCEALIPVHRKSDGSFTVGSPKTKAVIMGSSKI